MRVRQHKAEHPEAYCLHARCLYRTVDDYCPKHLRFGRLPRRRRALLVACGKAQFHKVRVSISADQDLGTLAAARELFLYGD